MKIYAASSWRNDLQPGVVKTLREHGHAVYDFRNPSEGISGFSWSEIDPAWQEWTQQEYVKALQHRRAREAFSLDLGAMQWADAFVLVMPCGRSAHLEAGWATGVGKPTAVLLSDSEPELMYKLADVLCYTVDKIVGWLESVGV